MKNLYKRFPVYSDCSKVEVIEYIEESMAAVFAANPFPDELVDRILWLHDMYAAIRNVEADATITSGLADGFAELFADDKDDTLVPRNKQEVRNMEAIEYITVGDYQIPNLTLEEQPAIGKYGMLRKRYLKEHRRGAYNAMLLSGELFKHLADVDTAVHESVFLTVSEMAKKQGVDEALKARDQLAWVSAMNAIKAQAEEIASSEYIYD